MRKTKRELLERAICAEITNVKSFAYQGKDDVRDDGIIKRIDFLKVIIVKDSNKEKLDESNWEYGESGKFNASVRIAFPLSSEEDTGVIEQNYEICEAGFLIEGFSKDVFNVTVHLPLTIIKRLN